MTLRVLHLTDTHFSAGRDPVAPPKTFADAVYALSGRTTDEAAWLVGSKVKAARPDLVLHTGDLVDEPTTKAYAAARSMLDDLGRPLLLTAGNHDDPAIAQQAGLSMRPLEFIDLGAWRIVTVCSARAGQQHGTFGPELLASLEGALSVERPVLIATHHPPLSICSDHDCNVSDAAAFFDVLDRHANVVAVATGHLHHAGELRRRDVRYLLGPSTCLQLVHQHPIPENNRVATPLGARNIDLADDGTLSSELVWLPAAGA